MKKHIALTLVLVLCLALAACGDEVPVETTAAAVLPTETKDQNVTITMDNWEQYFELRPTTDVYVDESGKVQNWSFCYGVFLREEYDYVSGSVNFEVEYRTEQHPFSGDRKTGEYTLGEATGTSENPRAVTFALEDSRRDPNTDPQSGFFDAVAGRVYGGNVAKEKGEVDVPIEGRVLHAEGTILLR